MATFCSYWYYHKSCEHSSRTRIGRVVRPRVTSTERLVLCLFMAAVCTNLCRLIESNRNQHSLRATRWQCCQLITIQLIRRMVERVCVECDLVTVGWSRDSQWLISRDCDPKGLQICRLAFVGRALISQLYRYLAADSNLWTTGVNPRWVAANESGVVLPLWAIRWWTHELELADSRVP